MVAIIITTFNHAHFLPDAIESCLAQAWPASEIVVVDDGSADDPKSVVDRYSGVGLIRQENRGLSGARNTGLAATKADAVIFLDADDRLLPTAVEAGIKAMDAAPNAALTFGAYRYINGKGEITAPTFKHMLKSDPYLQLLREGNIIGMHATVMYRRQALTEIGGFDECLRACEDYDVFLRIARRRRLAEHGALVAEYRRHGENMSLDRPYMLDYALRVLDKQSSDSSSADERRAIADGRKHVLGHYAGALAKDGLRAFRQKRPGEAAGMIAKSLRMHPGAALSKLGQAAARRARRGVPAAFGRAMGIDAYAAPRLGAVKFGDFARTTPISDQFGFDRGKPVDRYYIEGFLERHSSDIHGRVLEIGDNEYTLRFGGHLVEKSDVLHVAPGNPMATIVGDLSESGVLPEAAFDCIVLTQTLHLIFDMPKAVAALHRSLRPGGVLLLTVPGITPVDRDEWGSTWYWSLTESAVTRLLALSFQSEHAAVAAFGNVFAACAFLQGLAVAELPEWKLDVADPAFPVIVAARAVRQAAP